MPKVTKALLISLLVVSFLPIGYLLSGPYFDRRAKHQANKFCMQISIGETFNSLSAKAEKNGVLLEKWLPRPGGEERFMVRFPGFLANAVYFQITTVQKKVQARFVEEEFW